MTDNWSRRAFLRGVTSTAMALPLMASLGFGRKARGDVNPFPKRLIIMFSPNGTVQNQWRPSTNLASGSTLTTLSPVLEPLALYKNDIIQCDGLDMLTSDMGPGDGHQRGMGHMLTGRILSSDGEFEGGGGGNPVGYPMGASIDQAVAAEIGKTTKLRSLELGVQVTGATIWHRMSYLTANRPLAPDNSPHVVYDRLFGDLDVSPAELIQRNTRRKRIIDMVKADYNRLAPRLDAFDRDKLEGHIEALRDIESRLTLSVAGVSDTCVRPDSPILLPSHDPVVVPHMHERNYRAVGELQMDLAVQAFACDITRVATIQFSQSVSQHRFTDIGINDHHHDLSHEGNSNAGAQEKLTAINQWYATQMAYLIGKLKSVREGDGTMLDNTVVMWINELGEGNSHTRNNVPVVLAGKCGGYFKTGRYMNFKNLARGTSHTDLLLTLAHACGVTGMRSFGESAHSNGPLTALQA